ncbi:MAG TPA: hypothetical protein VJ255_16280, partial [Candidatus Acidoferrum sp.]|nr:hypothetical protein [Candidatus Acidoferrum sp.]
PVCFVSRPPGCTPTPPSLFLASVDSKGREKHPPPAGAGKQKAVATKATPEAQPRAPWALGKAGRRLLESKLPKEAVDMILVR